MTDAQAQLAQLIPPKTAQRVLEFLAQRRTGSFTLHTNKGQILLREIVIVEKEKAD